MTPTRRPWLVAIAYTDLPSDARVIRETHEELRAGARVTVLVPRGSEPRVPNELSKAEIVWLPVSEERGRTTVRGHLRFMRAIRRWRKTQRERPDVVHVHNMPDYLLWSVRPWQREGTRVVLDVHDIMSQLASHRFRGAKRAIAIPVLRAIEGRSWRQADALVTVHDAYAELIAERGIPRERITSVLNVPDPAVVHGGLRRDPNPSAPKLVFHGAVTVRSGVIRAVEAMPLILERVPSAQLLIIGTGDARDKVSEAIARHDLRNAVTFVDRYVPLVEALHAIADADVGLVPTEVSAYTQYMLPVKLTEYAVLGIPTIATRLPLVEKYFGEQGAHLLAHASPQAIADAAVQVLSDREYRERLSMGARKFARTHEWSIYANALRRAVGLLNGMH